MAQDLERNSQSIAGIWIEKFGGILQSMTDELPEVWQAAADAAPLGRDLLIWEQRVSLSPEMVLWVAAPEATWLELGSRTLNAAGIDNVEPTDARNTWHEILSQASSALCQALSARTPTEFAVEPGSEIAASPSGADLFPISVEYPGSAVLKLTVGFNQAWSELAIAAVDVPGENEEISRPELDEGQLSTASLANSKTFDLLLDVGLPVSVSFGRAQLPIRDVLKLTTGSIVQLNRTVTEPVEVIVNGCVIARGDVVVVEGNYGVRVKQIVSRQDRLRTGIHVPTQTNAKASTAGLKSAAKERP